MIGKILLHQNFWAGIIQILGDKRIQATERIP